MTAAKRGARAEERVAREIHRMTCGRDDLDQCCNEAGHRAVAAWHLAAVRRARGRTVGYVAVENGPGNLCCKGLHLRASAEDYCANGGYMVARVVLLPAAKRGGSKGAR